MDNILRPCLELGSKEMSDVAGISFSLLSLIFIASVILIITLLLILPKKIKFNKIIGDIFFGIGVGVFAGTIFTFSIRTQLEMFVIYSLAGIVFLSCGTILKNFS